MVGSTRADLGATENRFQATVDRLVGALGDTTASESRIRDTDMASTVRDLSRGDILMQAGSSMLAQANQSPQTLLKLLAA
jgi:flagellin